MAPTIPATGRVPQRSRAAGILLTTLMLLSARASRAQQPVSSVPPSQPAVTGGPQATPNTGFAAGPSVQVAQPGIGPLFGSPFGNNHLFGDWDGARTWLEDHGIGVDLDWLTENAGNITGGRRQGFDFAGQVGFEVDLDLQKLIHLDGAAFHSMIVNGNGRNLSNDYIGDDLATVQEIYGGRGNVVARMVYAYYEQALAHDRIDVVAGWLPVGTYFASSPIYCDFVNVLFCGNPHPLPNYPGEADWPDASFGGQVRLLPIRQLYLMFGLYSVDTSYGNGGGGISGWAWADPHKSGVSIPVEIGWVPHLGRDRLVGHYKLGYDHDTHHYADVLASADGSATGHGRDMYYALADQMLVRQGPGDTDGVIVFAGYTHASDRVSPLTTQAFAGLISTGSAWHRPADTLGIAYHWIEMSGAFTRAEELAQLTGASLPITIDGFGPAYGPQNTEQVVELNYAASVIRGVTLIPDFQYIIRPGATTAIPDAAVLGFRTNITF